MSASLQLPGGLKTLNPQPEIARYYNVAGSTYIATTQVLSEIVPAARYVGQTFLIVNTEYWFMPTTADADLVAKSADDSGFVHKAGAETLTGEKTWTLPIDQGAIIIDMPLSSTIAPDAILFKIHGAGNSGGVATSTFTQIYGTKNVAHLVTPQVGATANAGFQFSKPDGIGGNIAFQVVDSIAQTFKVDDLGVLSATTLIKRGGLGTEYLMADGSVLTNATLGLNASQVSATPHIDYLTGNNVQLQLDQTENSIVGLVKTDKTNFKDIYQTGRVRIDTDASVLSISPADTLNITAVDNILFINEILPDTPANKIANFLLSFGNRTFVANATNTLLAANTRGVFYVGVDKLGTSVYRTSKVYDQDVCYLARIIVANTAGAYSVVSFKYFPDLANNRVNNHDRLVLSSGYIVPSGAASISFGNRAVSFSKNSINYSISKFDPNYLSVPDTVNPTPMQFLFALPNLSSLAVNIALSTIINPTQWYNSGGTVGAGAVAGANYQVYRLLVSVTGTLIVQTKASTSNAPAFGINAIFANRDDALAGLSSVVFPDILPIGDAIALGTFYLRAGTAVNGSQLNDPNDFYFRPFTASSSSSSVGVTIHDLLSGKNDNPAFQHVTTTDIGNWNAKATDSLVVHKALTETITGQKIFQNANPFIASTSSTTQAMLIINNDIGALISLGINGTTMPDSPTYGNAGDVFVRASATANNLVLITAVAKDIIFKTNNVEVMRVLANGNVGINSPTSPYRLHVGGTTYFGGTSIIDGQASVYGNLIVEGTVYPDQIRTREDDADFPIWAYSPAGTGKMKFLTGLGVERMTIFPDGKVAIGSASALELLHVGGKIYTEGIRIPQNAGYYNIQSGVAGGAISFGVNNGTFDRNLYLGFTDNSAVFTPQVFLMYQTNRVGFGTASPFGKIHTKADGANVVLESVSDGLTATPVSRRMSWLTTQPTECAWIDVPDERQNTNGVSMRFATKDQTNTLAERMRITTDGNLEVVGRINTNSNISIGGGVYANSPFNIYKGAIDENGVLQSMAKLINTNFNSTQWGAGVETALVFGWANHYGASLSAYKPAGDRTGFKIYSELGFNTRTIHSTFAPEGNLTVVGNITAAAFFTSSDIRLKKVVKSIHKNPTELNPISFTWKDKKQNQKVQIGYSAQDVQKYIPNAVSEDAGGNLTVNYTQVLVAKISSLEEQIKELRALILNK
ncbi:MAG TPA: tail fiber domain-containing protein [Flavobacterium sp.]